MKYSFEIIETLDKTTNYNDQTLSNDKCIYVSSELVNTMSKYLINLKTYQGCFSNASLGLANEGVTIIPPQSLMFLNDIVTTLNKFRKSEELVQLSDIVITAKVSEKCVLLGRVT